jgi:hypothetical protein
VGLLSPISKRVIIQNTTATSQNKTERKILSKSNELVCGKYIKDENKYWLISSYSNDNGFYSQNMINLCTRSLKFQKPNGDIVEYPYFVENQLISVEENKFLLSSDTEIRIKLSFDDNTKLFSYDKRFMGEVFNGVPQCWKIIDLSTDNGLLCVTLEKDEYNKDTDNIQLGVCDYITPASLVSDLIITGSKTIKKLTSQIYSATEDVVWTVTNVDESSNNYITTSEITDTSIKLTSGNFVGKYITLTATSQLDSEITTNITIQITNTI